MTPWRNALEILKSPLCVRGTDAGRKWDYLPSDRAGQKRDPINLPVLLRTLRPIRLSRRSEPFDSDLLIYELLCGAGMRVTSYEDPSNRLRGHISPSEALTGKVRYGLIGNLGPISFSMVSQYYVHIN